MIWDCVRKKSGSEEKGRMNEKGGSLVFGGLVEGER